MEQDFQYDVFLSHSAKDKAVVGGSSLSASIGERAGVRCRSLHLAERSRKDGVKVWPVAPDLLGEGGFDNRELPVAASRQSVVISPGKKGTATSIAPEKGFPRAAGRVCSPHN